MEEIQYMKLTDEDLDRLADRVCSRLASIQQNEFKKMREYTFHNTRLLLSNYRKLSAHVKNVEEQLEEDKETFWDHRYLTLSSLMQNKAKTVKIMRNVDKALAEYKQECADNGSINYSILDLKYLAKRSMSDELIASRFGIDRTTVNRKTKEAINELSPILYGVGALDIK